MQRLASWRALLDKIRTPDVPQFKRVSIENFRQPDDLIETFGHRAPTPPLYTTSAPTALCHAASMGFKRPHSDEDGALLRHNAPNKRMKQHFQSHKAAAQGNSTQLGVSLHEVKRRARNIERRFAKGDDLPADVKQKLERELVQCKTQIDEISHKKRRHDMISKYHRVRFFGTHPSLPQAS